MKTFSNLVIIFGDSRFYTYIFVILECFESLFVYQSYFPIILSIGQCMNESLEARKDKRSDYEKKGLQSTSLTGGLDIWT